MVRAPMTRDEVDAALVALGAAHDRIAAALYAVDSHAGLAFLRRGTVSGQTARLAEEVLPRTEALWAQFSVFGERLDRARTLRAERSRPGPQELVELSRALRDPTVRLARDGIPVEDTAPGAGADAVGLPELAARLDAGTRQAGADLDRVDAACVALAGRLAPLVDGLSGARAGARQLGGADLEAEVDRLAAALTRATDAAMGDPLAAADTSATELDAQLDRITAELAGVRERLADLARVRDTYPQQLEQLRADVDRLAAAEQDASRAYATAADKITEPGLPAVPTTASSMPERLAGLDRLAAAGQWDRLADQLRALERAVATGRQRAGQLREAAEGLLARRAELRGRLDAYRAKAARSGLVEDADLGERHRAAHELLYTSPCDLPAATRAVVAYQRALAARLAGAPGASQPPREPTDSWRQGVT
jgi:hypothetical protein